MKYDTTPVKPPGSLAYRTLNRIYRYGLLTLMTFVGILVFFYSLFLVPLRFISHTAFTRACSVYLRLIVPGFLCVPFSWVTTNLYCNGLGTMREYATKNLVVQGNHSARVDWLLALYIGCCYGQRITFVTEAFILILPFIGWFRYIMEDMFVFRSFKRDRERLEKNIEHFHKAGVTRWVFISPEGHIADFNPTDQLYIKECEEFCKERGLEPFEMCLTPRYKGMSCFNKVDTKGEPGKNAVNLAVCMTYVQNGDRLVKPLRNPNRVVPDLWTVLQGNLHCVVHNHRVELSMDPDKLRDQLMNDQAMKNKILKEFYLTGRFPEAYPGKSHEESPEFYKPVLDPKYPIKKIPGTDVDDVFQLMQPNHVEMNISMFVQVAIALTAMYYMGILHHFPKMLAGLYVILVMSHMTGEYLANGQSRESLPFEGFMKALMFRFQGIEGADAEKKVKEKLIHETEAEGQFPSDFEAEVKAAHLAEDRKTK